VIKPYLKYLLSTFAIALSSQVFAQTPVEVKLVAAFEEDRGYCLDVRGAPGKTAPIGGLRTESCKMYSLREPGEDQAFDMENIHENNEFRMSKFGDKCLTLYKPARGSFVSLETCDGRTAQSIKLNANGQISPEIMPELCLTIGAVTLPGGGGKPLHIWRNVTFEDCDTSIHDRQSWELRAVWSGPQEATVERPYKPNPKAQPPSQ